MIKKSLERVPVRLRGHDITQSAWRLELESDQGAGSIVRVEVSPTESCYRGDGICLGGSQERLAKLWAHMTADADDAPDLLQLG